MLLLRAPADQRFSVAIANRERPAQSARLHFACRQNSAGRGANRFTASAMINATP